MNAATRTTRHVPEQDVADIIHATADAAFGEVFNFSARFESREDYQSLEQLASDVQHAAVKAEWQAARRERRGAGE